LRASSTAATHPGASTPAPETPHPEFPDDTGFAPQTGTLKVISTAMPENPDRPSILDAYAALPGVPDELLMRTAASGRSGAP
jgi:hypothetical protein